MAILKFVPSPKKIRDNRSNENGYYEAACNVCGTLFFPKRSNAKYCTSKCAQNNHRMALVGVKKPKKDIVVPDAKIVAPNVVLTGKGAVVGYLQKEGIKVHGLLTALKSTEVGKSTTWKGYNISRISSVKYGVGKTHN